MAPIIPWIGGKRRLVDLLLSRFPSHSCYVEVFAGGAAVFFARHPADVEVLNDVNGDLVNLYRVVTHHLEEFVRQFKWALTSRQVFKWLQETRPETLTDVQRAARFFYLQQQSFGGKVAGQTFGTATTAPAINLLRIEENLSAAHLRLAAGTYIENLDWATCIDRYDRSHTLFYLDPPYWETEGYGVPFPWEQYELMAAKLKAIKGKAVVSINDHPAIRSCFAGFDMEALKLDYTVGGGANRVERGELVIYSWDREAEPAGLFLGAIPFCCAKVNSERFIAALRLQISRRASAVVCVLVLSPSSYGKVTRRALARHLYLDTAPVLLGFTVLAALISLVLTRIVVVTAISYGLSRYALEMVIRVLVLELIPLTAALFVAMRCTIPNGTQLALLRQSGHLARLSHAGADPVRVELLPRAVAGVFACITLAALSCVVALVLAYLGVYGFSLAGLPSYTRMFGHVFAPAVTLVFVIKTVLFSLAVALIPMAAGLYDTGERTQPDSELGGLARMFAVLLLIEIGSLVGNYY